MIDPLFLYSSLPWQEPYLIAAVYLEQWPNQNTMLVQIWNTNLVNTVPTDVLAPNAAQPFAEIIQTAQLDILPFILPWAINDELLHLYSGLPGRQHVSDIQFN